MDSSLWPLLLLSLSAIATVAWLREHVRSLGDRRLADSATAMQEATLRLLRLSAGDQRNVALTLFGYAEVARPPDQALTGLARRLLDMSEDLTQHTETPAATRCLTEENVELMAVAEFAMAQVAAHLGPSRRVWRLDPAFGQTRLLADRRALNQVLVNVLTSAAASTRDRDWIELNAEAGATDWAIIVQDEGIGLPAVQTSAHPDHSRGIGLRLTLARSLMQAHGGTLAVESTEQVGTRVRLGFPNARVLESPY